MNKPRFTVPKSERKIKKEFVSSVVVLDEDLRRPFFEVMRLEGISGGKLANLMLRHCLEDMDYFKEGK